MMTMIDEKLHDVKVESITQRLMLIELFNDYCDAQYYYKFQQCENTFYPQISDDSHTVVKKITKLNIDNLASLSESTSNKTAELR